MLRSGGSTMAVALCLLGVAAQAVAGGPRSPQWVSDRVQINGIPVELRSAVVTMPLDEIAASLVRLWQSAGADGVVVADPRRLGDGQTVIGRQRGPMHEVVGLRRLPSGGTRILVSVSDLSRPPARLPAPPFRLARHHRLVSVVEMLDRERQRVYVIHALETPSSTHGRLHSALVADGWRVRSTDVRASGHVLWADRRHERLEAVVLDDGSASRLVLRVAPYAP